MLKRADEVASAVQNVLHMASADCPTLSDVACSGGINIGLGRLAVHMDDGELEDQDEEGNMIVRSMVEAAATGDEAFSQAFDCAQPKYRSMSAPDSAPIVNRAVPCGAPLAEPLSDDEDVVYASLSARRFDDDDAAAEDVPCYRSAKAFKSSSMAGASYPSPAAAAEDDDPEGDVKRKSRREKHIAAQVTRLLSQPSVA